MSAPPVGVAPEIARVHRAAQQAGTARDELVAAIRDARTRGLSLRAIAAAAGVSQETIRKWAGEA